MIILVIEDSRQEVALLRTALSAITSSAIQVEHADRLSSACSSLTTGRFDAILLDLNLPDSAGLNTFVRVQARAPEVPVVIITNLDDEGLAMEGIRAGAQDYIVKGRYEGALLYRSLRTAVERKRLVTDLKARADECPAELAVAKLKQAEKKQGEQELLNTLMLNMGPSCIKRVSSDGTLLQMNPVGLRLIEACGEQDVLGLSVFELVLPEHRAAFVSMHHDVIDGHARTLQFKIQGLKGTCRWMETYAVPFRNPVTGYTEHLAVTNDITEGRKREDALLAVVEGVAAQTGEEFFSSFVRRVATAFDVRYAYLSEMDAEGTHFRSTAAWGCGAFLQPFAVPVGSPCETVLTGQAVHHPDQLHATYPHVRWIADLGVISYCGVPVVDRTGRVIGHIAIMDDKPMPDGKLAIPLLQVFASRIAAEQERKWAVQSLEHSRSLLQSFVEHTPAAVAMLDQQLRYVAVSQRWYQDYQLGERDIIGQHHYDVFPEIREMRAWQDIYQRCLAGAIERREEDLLVRPSGHADWLRW